ncbi:hypothetical protein Pmani_034240 [Petrolisthes manimaculis]|uniref:Uncharacterized protein n=1 Tax=Petrolisthes manimaculis TaxID=1843537 RepID=A0AAE1NPQ1_9EUCA|nr:hypothetical protein Pmani_034240 [Petrolisthes manimaculis]
MATIIDVYTQMCPVKLQLSTEQNRSIVMYTTSQYGHAKSLFLFSYISLRCEGEKVSHCCAGQKMCLGLSMLEVQ